MRTFKLDEQYTVVCRDEGTRYGFRHLASLMRGGYEIAKGKMCYYNRSWESFEFESVIFEVINKAFKGDELAKYIGIVKNSEYGKLLK